MMQSNDILVRKNCVELCWKVSHIFGKDVLFEHLKGKLDRYSEMVIYNFVISSQSSASIPLVA